MDERAELLRSLGPAALLDLDRKHRRRDDSRRAGVLPVVTDICDPVRPAHDLAFRSRRCGTRPRVVPDPVEGLLAEVETSERDVRAPDRVVESLGQEAPEGVLARMSGRPVPAVVTQGDRLRERHVETERARDRRRYLCNLEGVGQPRPLVVLREDEHLGLACEASEGSRVQDPVPVALEARPPLVRRFLVLAAARLRAISSLRGRGAAFRRPPVTLWRESSGAGYWASETEGAPIEAVESACAVRPPPAISWPAIVDAHLQTAVGLLSLLAQTASVPHRCIVVAKSSEGACGWTCALGSSRR